MAEFELEEDSELAAALERFKEIEPLHFRTIQDQVKAGLRYHEAVTSHQSLLVSLSIRGRKLSESEENIQLPSGVIVLRGGVYQEILDPFGVRIRSVDYGSMMSRPLPDGSCVFFSAALAQHLIRA